MASTDARPIPIKNTAFRAVFPILDADGDLVTGATGLDSEVSKDQGTFADCTNEATEIATASGMYYLDLTSTEMNADCVAIIVKTTSSGAKTTVLVFYPVEAGDIDVDVTAWNGTAVSSPATAGIPEVNVKNINNVSASSVTTVNANQGTTQPINFTGTGASALAKGDMVDVAGAAVSTSTAQLGVNVVQAGGTAWGSGAITAAAIASNAITSAKIASGAITSTGIAASAIGASQLATGAITNATFAAGAIDAAAIAANAIGASELAADAVAEIADAIWDEATSGHVTAGSYGLAASDILADTADMQPKLGTPAGASVSADIAAVQSDTDAIQLSLNGMVLATDNPLGTGNDTTHINLPLIGYPDDALNDLLIVIYDDNDGVYYARWIADWVSSTQLATVAVLPFTPTIAGRFWLLPIRRDSGLTAAETRAAVGLASANLDTQLTAIDDYIDTEVAAIKAKTDLIPASPAATSDIPSAATIADAVWDEALSGHTTAGSGGKALSDIDTHTDTEVASILAAVDTEVAAIKAKTDQLTFTTANQVDATTMSMAANALTAAATASDFGTEVATAVWASATRTLSALGFTLSASDLAADTITAAKIADGAIDAATFAAGAINAAAIADGAIDRATFAADTGLQTIRSNTAQAGAAGSITLDASASATTDFYKGSWIFLTGGTGVGQTRLCTAYNGTSKVATITPNWATNPDATSTFAVLPAAGVDLELIANAAVSTSTAQLGVNAVQAGGTAWGSGAITAAAIASNAITSAKIASGAITSTGIAASAIGASQLASGAITNAKFAAGAIDAAAIAADAIGASELAADAATEIGTAVWATAARTLTAATNITSTGGTTVPQTGDSYARLGAPAGASVSADVAAVKTDTGNILTKLLKYVQLMVRKDSAIATDNATELTAINANGGSGAGSFDNTTDSEQAIRDNMTTPPTAAAIADQVWEEAIADHSGTTGSTAEALNSAGSAGDPWTTALPGAYGAGSAGKIIGDNINATISSRASQASVDTIDDYIDTEVAAIKAKTDQLTFTTAGQVDATTMSVANNALTAAAAAADLGTEIATAVWASATRTLSALGFTLGASDLAADTITAAKIATDAIGSDELATSAVTEIVNAVLTTAMTESYNADGAAPTLAQALFMTMQRLTEFAISGTTVTVKKLDGSTTAYTLTLDDATDPTSTTRAT